MSYPSNEEQFRKYFRNFVNKHSAIQQTQNIIFIPQKVFQIHSVLRLVFERSRKGLYSQSVVEKIMNGIMLVLNNKLQVIWEGKEFAFKEFPK